MLSWFQRRSILCLVQQMCDIKQVRKNWNKKPANKKIITGMLSTLCLHILEGRLLLFSASSPSWFYGSLDQPWRRGMGRLGCWHWPAAWSPCRLCWTPPAVYRLSDPETQTEDQNKTCLKHFIRMRRGMALRTVRVSGRGQCQSLITCHLVEWVLIFLVKPSLCYFYAPVI